jgi:hypothetical protein
VVLSRGSDGRPESLGAMEGTRTLLGLAEFNDLVRSRRYQAALTKL